MRSGWLRSKASDELFQEDSRATSSRLLRVGIGFAVVGVTIQTAIHLLNAALDGSQYLSVNGEGNPVTWVHSGVIFAAAFVCTLRTTILTERRREWAAMAAMLAFLSFDEMLVVHERVVAEMLEVLELPLVWDSVVWPVLYLPLLGALLLLLVTVARLAPTGTGSVVLVGLGFLVAAVAAEVLSAPVSTSGESWPHVLEGAVEEGAELVGWILITTSLTAITLAEFLASSREGPVRRVTEAAIRDVGRPDAERERQGI